MQQGANVDSLNSNGESALFLACKNGHHDVVRFLLENRSLDDCEAELTKRGRALLVACKRRHHKIVKLLLENGADPQAKDEDNKSALYHAVKSIPDDDYSEPDLSTVNLLLDRGADTNETTSSGKTALYVACRKGLTTTVERMLKCGVEVNVNRHSKNRSPLNIACLSRNTATVQLLLSNGADPNIPEETRKNTVYALHIAAICLNVELVNLLLNHGANVNTVDSRGCTALHYAAFGRVPILSARSACADADIANSQRILDMLLHAGADVNIRNGHGETALFFAAVGRELLDFVEIMLLNGGNPNLVEADGYHVLNLICLEPTNLELVEILLKGGADPNVPRASSHTNRFGDLPLYIAVTECNFELVTLLLTYGANVNYEDYMGMTPLHFAIKELFENEERIGADLKEMTPAMTKLLLEHGADVNRVLRAGWTHLRILISHYVSYRRHSADVRCVRDLLRMLINSGATLDLNNKSELVWFGFRILKLLCVWCSTDQVEADLLKAGATVELLAYSYALDNSQLRLPGGLRANSVRLCQAAVMAGYRPSSEELDDLRQSVSGGHPTPEYMELMSWLNEDGQQPASLMRQCRVAIRRQLSLASRQRTILPAVDQLPLPTSLQQYLKFEGILTEVDLELQVDVAEEEANDAKELPVSSVTASDVDGRESADDDGDNVGDDVATDVADDVRQQSSDFRDRMPLPTCLLQYLKFEGRFMEEVVKHQAWALKEEANEAEELQESSDDASDVDGYESADDV